jgi:hypothetical protein
MVYKLLGANGSVRDSPFGFRTKSAAFLKLDSISTRLTVKMLANALARCYIAGHAAAKHNKTHQTTAFGRAIYSFESTDARSGANAKLTKRGGAANIKIGGAVRSRDRAWEKGESQSKILKD